MEALTLLRRCMMEFIVIIAGMAVGAFVFIKFDLGNKK